MQNKLFFSLILILSWAQSVHAMDEEPKVKHPIDYLITASQAGQELPHAMKQQLAETLYFAAIGNDLILARKLIAAQVDVDGYTGEDKRTALLAITGVGLYEMCELLVDAGANVNHLDYQGQTALMFAARWNYPNVCALLLESGADVNAANRYCGRSALGWAVCNGNITVCELLINAGADVWHTERSGLKMLFLARSSKETSELITAAMLQSAPQKSYCFLNCLMKNFPTEFTNLRNIFKPYLQGMIRKNRAATFEQVNGHQFVREHLLRMYFSNPDRINQ